MVSEETHSRAGATSPNQSRRKPNLNDVTSARRARESSRCGTTLLRPIAEGI
jgi:hypothetical protein